MEDVDLLLIFILPRGVSVYRRNSHFFPSDGSVVINISPSAFLFLSTDDPRGHLSGIIVILLR